MVRTQIYITEKERDGLVRLAAENGIKQSELIRQAVDNLLERSVKKSRLTSLRQARGLWKHRQDVPRLRTLRAQFDRY